MYRVVMKKLHIMSRMTRILVQGFAQEIWEKVITKEFHMSCQLNVLKVKNEWIQNGWIWLTLWSICPNLDVGFVGNQESHRWDIGGGSISDSDAQSKDSRLVPDTQIERSSHRDFTPAKELKEARKLKEAKSMAVSLEELENDVLTSDVLVKEEETNDLSSSFGEKPSQQVLVNGFIQSDSKVDSVSTKTAISMAPVSTISVPPGFEDVILSRLEVFILNESNEVDHQRSEKNEKVV